MKRGTPLMIELYTWNTPNGRKISIALEELGLPYNVHPIDIMKDEQFAPDFLKISPNNKIPAIVDNATGQAVFESGAILLYLAEKAGKLMLDGSAKWDVLQWLMWQMGGFGPMLGQAHHFVKFNPDVSEYATNRYAKEAQRLYRVLDKQLAEKAWLAGDEITIADIATWPWASRFEWQGIDYNDFPNAKRWYIACAERDGFKKGYDVPSVGAEIPMP